MKELSWQGVLEAQQKDFIQRLKYSLRPHPSEFDVVTLSRLEYNPCCWNESYHSELIELYLQEPEEEEIGNFCEELVDKFGDEDEENKYKLDNFTNYKIGKLGEKAVKTYLGNLITEVDYEIYNYGDRGVDFWLASNRNIGVDIRKYDLSKW